MIELYLKEIMNFLRTSTVKSTLLAAHTAEQEAIRQGKESISDMENPYYLRLAGQYTANDIPMTLQSIDDGSTILLERGLELTHPKTANVYRLPNVEYDKLCRRYPTQIDLIKAIVYPIDNIETAIAADDMTILNADINIFNSNEQESMYNTFKELVMYFKDRWVIPEYSAEEYYPLALWAAFWSTAATALFVQRIKNLKTNNVHPFHIWEYLKSKGLDDFRTVLDTKQQLFLYHNMRFLNRERGKTSTLNIIADNLLQDYGITLNTKSIVVDTAGSEVDCKVLPEIISENIDGNELASNSDMYSSTESISTMTQRLYENELDLDASQERKDDSTKLFQSSKSTYVPTKLVELTKVDLNTEYVDLFYATIFHLFLYNYTQGYLTFTNTAKLPISGNSRLFTIGETFALMHYCSFGDRGTALPIDIPTEGLTFFADYNPETIIPDYFWFGGVKYKLSNIINVPEFLDAIPTHPGVIESPEDMMIYFDKIFVVIKSDSVRLRLNGDTIYHAAIEHIYSYIIKAQMIPVDLIPGYTTYQAWFDSDESLKGIMDQIAAMSRTEAKGYYESFYNNVFEGLFPVEVASYATSIGLNANMYASMKNLFMQLCSYNIAFIDSDRTQKSHIITNPITSYPKYVEMLNTDYIELLWYSPVVSNAHTIITEVDTSDHVQIATLSHEMTQVTEFNLGVFNFDEDTETTTVIYSSKYRTLDTVNTMVVNEYLHSSMLATDENYN